MSPDESFGLGYLCGQAQIGTPSNPKLPDICRSRELRMQFRKGWTEGYQDARRGIRNAGKPPKITKSKRKKFPIRRGQFVAAPSRAQLMAGK